MTNTQVQDVLIIGSGAAGLCLALKFSDKANVAVLSKSTLDESATRYAQGGISAVFDDNDSIESHVQDTINIGAGLCDSDMVRYVVERGQQSINWLVDIGVKFTPGEDDSHPYHLHQEAGHSHRRILHNDDSTGQVLEETLTEQAKNKARITLLEQHTAIDLITVYDQSVQKKRCVGAYVFDENKQKVITIAAKIIVLATGGAGKVYLYTSNPDNCTGDGIAMAWRAGCRIANMEFIQFHPTCLYHPEAKSFLISESLRGEGAKLKLLNHQSFMQQFDSRGELAPRDIVARAIDEQMKQRGDDCVYLDISHLSADFIQNHFPTIYKHCLALGIDICKQPIPVVPAVHYTCGGIMVDQHGKTDLSSLYAIGETSYTGLHGANRMASNSLLECIVFGHAAYESIQEKLAGIPSPPHIAAWDESRVIDSNEEVVVSHNWEEIRRFMWDYVGIIRTDKRLARAKRRISLLQEEILEYYSNFRITKDLIELRNIAQVAEIIIQSAVQRKERRGLHCSLDYPQTNQLAKNTILQYSK